MKLRWEDGDERLDQVFYVSGVTTLNLPTYLHLRDTPAFLEVLGRGYTDLMYWEGASKRGGIAVAVTFVRNRSRE